MVAGLIDHPMSYKELIRLRLYPLGKVREGVNQKLQEMQSEEKVKAGKRTKRPKSEERVIWHAPPKQEHKEAA